MATEETLPHCVLHDLHYTGIKCPQCAETESQWDQMAPAKAQRIADNAGPVFAGERPPEATKGLPTGANAIQVGGDHYQTEYQHWDFVADLGLDYYQACATKYVTRWRKKNGLEDLQKAPHYMRKRAELIKAKRIEHNALGDMPHSKVIAAVFRLGQANGLDALDTEAIYLIVMGRDAEATDKLEKLISAQAH